MMDALELLYDHYKETNNYNNQMQTKRNRLFVYVCIIELLNFVMLIFPEFITQALSAFLENNYAMTIDAIAFLLPSFLWLITLYVLVRYYQTAIYIERQYSYIAKLEAEISTRVKSFDFKRESDFYSLNYPKALDIIHTFYTWIVPIALLVINIIKLVLEFFAPANKFTTIFDTIICVFILLLSISYLCFMHKKERNEPQNREHHAKV